MKEVKLVDEVPTYFDKLPIGCLFLAGENVYLKIGPIRNLRVQRIPEQPSNCRCLTGKRKGHHCTSGPRVPVMQVVMHFEFR
jgi:hypothetical protein